jgi:hypothetical protein
MFNKQLIVMKKCLYLFFLLITLSLSAQFEQGFDVTRLQIVRPKGLCAADLDGDGLKDLVVTGGATGQGFEDALIGHEKLAWFRNLGNNEYSQRIVLSSEKYGGLDVGVADFDSDGDLDIFYSDYNIVYIQPPDLSTVEGGLYILVNDGNGNFSNPITVLENYNGYIHFLLQDANSDNLKDIIIRRSVASDTDTLDPGIIYNTAGVFNDYLPIVSDPSISIYDGSALNGDTNHTFVFAPIFYISSDTPQLFFSGFNNGNYEIIDSLICSNFPSQISFFDIDVDGLMDVSYVAGQKLVCRKNLGPGQWSEEILLLEQTGFIRNYQWRLEGGLSRMLYFSEPTIYSATVDSDFDLTINDTLVYADLNDAQFLLAPGVVADEYAMIFASSYCDCIRVNKLINNQLIPNGNPVANDTPSGQIYCIGDLNSDGQKDIIAGYGWYDNLGDNTFSQKIYSPEIAYPEIRSVEDFNGDSYSDIITVNSDGTFYHMGNGNLQFAPAVEIEVTYLTSETNSVKFLFYDDFNNDGLNELIIINSYKDTSISSGIVTNSTVLRVFSYNAQINNFELIHENTYPGFTFRPTKSKVNLSNTFIDFVGFGPTYPSQPNFRLLFLVNNGDFSFDFSAQEIPIGEFALADFNGDHLQDIVINTGPAFEDLMTIYFQGPNHTFNQFTSFGPFIFSIASIACQDVDLDGDIDILVGSENKPKFFYFENAGDNINFSQVAIDTTFGSFRRILLDDFDQDGDEDAVCSGLTDDGRITYYESTLAKPLKLPSDVRSYGNTVLLFPNPTQNGVSIKSEKEMRQIILYNSMGMETQSFSIHSSQHYIDARFLHPGLNFIRIVSNSNTYSQVFKIISQ